MDNLQFIQENLNKPIAEIALKLGKLPELDKDFILDQINGIQKAQQKLPEFSNNPNILYPKSLSIEQSSSEATAIFKSKLIKGKDLVDLTGGFGIDSFYFSKQIDHITHLEPNGHLHEIVKKNFDSLGASNINCIQTTAEDFLKLNSERFDIAYIDPSRRQEKQKVFKLEDCTPNIVELQNEIFKCSDQILVKTSPIMDIKESIQALKTVSTVWVVSVKNECKEVLYLLDKNPKKWVEINAVNLSTSQSAFTFDFEIEASANVEYSSPKKYLYEPNASILKAGGFKSIGASFNLQKLAPNSHLYTGTEIVNNFPGRVFSITQSLPYQAKAFKKLDIHKANVTCRNFKDSVQSVRKKLNLKDGGETYIFATTNIENSPIIVICTKK